MLATHVAPLVSPLCATSVRARRTERHSAWKHPGGPDGWCRGKHEKVPRWVTRSSSSDGVVPTSTERASDSWENRNHEEWRVYVRSLTGTTRRAALMATVGGLCVGPVLASDEEASTSLDDTFLSDSPSRDPSYPTVTAESNDPTQTDPNEDNPWEGSYVKPAMTVPQYIEEIAVNRSEAFTTLRTLADSLKFSQLDNELIIAPFDDVKQACFYLPWALVKVDERAGVETQHAWLRFREDLLALDAVAIDATRYMADEDDVLTAIDRLEKTLDEILDTVPANLKT